MEFVSKFSVTSSYSSKPLLSECEGRFLALSNISGTQKLFAKFLWLPERDRMQQNIKIISVEAPYKVSGRCAEVLLNK